MKKLIKSILIITPAIFFLACGENTEITPLKDISSIQIDDTGISVYSTDSKILTATVTYTDSTTASFSESELWSSSDYSVLSLYNGEIFPISNGGSATVSIEAGDFSDEENVNIIKLESFTVTHADITTTGEHVLEATGVFEDNTSKVIKRNIVWSATNDATITVDDNYVATIDILSGDTNVTATVFDETNTSAALAPITKVYSID